jgi:hypothetical protein
MHPAVRSLERSTYTPVEFRVERSVHGNVPSLVTVRTSGDLADRNGSENPRSPRFVVGDRYHVVAFRDATGVLTTNGCTATHRITIPPVAQPYVYAGMSLLILGGCAAAIRWLRAF